MTRKQTIDERNKSVFLNENAPRPGAIPRSRLQDRCVMSLSVPFRPYTFSLPRTRGGPAALVPAGQSTLPGEADLCMTAARFFLLFATLLDVKWRGKGGGSFSFFSPVCLISLPAFSFITMLYIYIYFRFVIFCLIRFILSGDIYFRHKKVNVRVLACVCLHALLREIKREKKKDKDKENEK